MIVIDKGFEEILVDVWKQTLSLVLEQQCQSSNLDEGCESINTLSTFGYPFEWNSVTPNSIQLEKNIYGNDVVLAGIEPSNMGIANTNNNGVGNIYRRLYLYYTPTGYLPTSIPHLGGDVSSLPSQWSAIQYAGEGFWFPDFSGHTTETPMLRKTTRGIYYYALKRIDSYYKMMCYCVSDYFFPQLYRVEPPVPPVPGWIDSNVIALFAHDIETLYDLPDDSVFSSARMVTEDSKGIVDSATILATNELFYSTFGNPWQYNTRIRCRGRAGQHDAGDGVHTVSGLSDGSATSIYVDCYEPLTGFIGSRRKPSGVKRPPTEDIINVGLLSRLIVSSYVLTWHLGDSPLLVDGQYIDFPL